MSVARPNLKEAAGKALARGTETRYEAVELGEKANIFEIQYLYGKRGRISGGQKREYGSALLGGSLSIYVKVTEVARPRVARVGRQRELSSLIRRRKSARINI